MSWDPLLRVPEDGEPRRRAWEEACQMTAWILARHPKATVCAFGSLVRPGAWHPRSDIDLAVATSEPTDALWSQLSDAFRSREVDIFPMGKTGSSRDEYGESARFRAEVERTAVKLPAPLPGHRAQPEILLLADRLETSLRWAKSDLRDIGKSWELATGKANRDQAEIYLSAIRFEAVRYRCRLEKAFSRTLGFIDRLPRGAGLDEDRLLVYRTATEELPGVRPPLLSRQVADWHSKHLLREYSLPDEDLEIARAHADELPAIHEATRVCLEGFAGFLRSHSQPRYRFLR